MRVLAVSVLFLLAACGGSSSPPDVDWSQVPQNQRQAIDDAVAAKDCQQMQTYFDGSKDADVLSYLDWQMKHAGCY
jgi:hypothetical protein